ncbi:hypothetical protein LQZ19_12355 [Treponema primitia]|uniref:hypothetical protein n=1 Tax=Treponema primitia TaxID=88058 RepID=UPI00397EC44B
MRKKSLTGVTVTALIFTLLFAACATTGGASGGASSVDNKLLGTWKIDLFENGTGVFVETFKADGTGYADIYVGGVKESSGGFYYTATGSKLSLRDSGGTTVMDYIITSDGKGISIKNWLGLGTDVIGVKE